MSWDIFFINTTKYLFLKDLDYSTVTDLEDTTNFPYLTFIYRCKTHKFGYVKELTDSSHLKLHNTISELKHSGLGFVKSQRDLMRWELKV